MAMKCSSFSLAVALSSRGAVAEVSSSLSGAFTKAAVERAGTDPLGAVISLLNGLVAKVEADGEAEAKAYKEFFEWCDDATTQTGFAIKTATSAKEGLEALIEEMASIVDSSDIKIGDLSESIAADEAELKDLMTVRTKEAKDFAVAERELKDVVNTLGRAITIVEREMQKNPAALAQVDTSSLEMLVKTLSTVVDAAALSSDDRKHLMALAQQQGSSQDEELADALGAPASATYKSQSGGVVDVLEDLKEKAEEQLGNLQKAETSAKHNYNMARQALEDQVAADSKTMEEQKVNKATAAEKKAVSESDLQRTLKDLAEGQEILKTSGANCMQTAADHQATVASRKEELKVLNQAISTLKSSTGGAAAQTYSLFQSVQNQQVHSSLQTHADLARSEVVTLVKRLAQVNHSPALAQLASRIAAVLKFGASAGEDPFAKVKNMIEGLISKLESEGSSEASEKEYCDEQMSKTASKKGELEFDVSKLSTKIDQAAARSTTLKAEVKDLQAELAHEAKSQAEMDKLRAESHSEYTQAKEDLEVGLTGIRNAMSVLRDYYGGASAALVQEDGTEEQPTPPEMHTKAAGAGSSIVAMLEVIESDFAKNLADEESQEADAESEYERSSQDNRVSKTLKGQDVKYKTQEYKAQDKALADMTGDKDTKSSELAAVLEYYSKVKGRCIARPESYEERKQRRKAEIEGLKQALEVLESETAFTQRSKRGIRKH